MPEEWAIVETYSTQFDADVALSTLEAAGIPACIPAPISPTMYPSITYAAGIGVAVPASQLDGAREILTGNSN